ncbi:hypothetical protein [Phenylobacterium sp.]|uniref:hypothetical protein n=1 Tax=Phenylobacterium sp. TaxID=1871053 RepID=UPI002735D231|nr:hypothetical protein [Phenylobacterium sp.]MDP3853163.1 hypothetical protein [Phenylobacterium sp.]
MALLMSQTEFAARHQVGKPAVSNWKAKGLLVFAPDPARPGKQLVDAEKSDLLVRGTIDPTRGRPRTSDQGEASAAQPETTRAPPAPTAIEAARLDEMQQRTRRRRIETEQLLGNLVPLAEYERRAGDMARLVRERTLALVRQHAERLAAETEPRTIISILGEAFDAMFDQLAADIDDQARAEREADHTLASLDDEEDEPPED